jgi:hypothetical protein
MNTDDDVQINYQGNPYCFYGENLSIQKNFEKVEDVVTFLLTEIEICEGKADMFTKNWIYDVCKCFLLNEDPWDVSGNQEYSATLVNDGKNKE